MASIDDGPLFDIDDDFGDPINKPSIATVYDVENNWSRLMEELKKEESIVAGYYSGVIVQAGNPSESPFKLDLIFPKGLEVMYTFSQKDPKSLNRLHLFLEEVLGRTIELNISQDSSLSNMFTKELTKNNKFGSQIFKEDLEEDSTFALINSIFDIKYEFSKQLPMKSTKSEIIIDAEIEDAHDD